MNEKNIKALLKGLGIPDSTITEAEKDDFDAAKVIADYNSSQKAHYHDIIKNEIAGEIESEVTTKVEGKFYGTLNNDIKKIYGVALDKIKDLPLHEKLKVAKAHLDELNKGASESEIVQKLQKENIEWQNKYTDLETGKQDAINKAIAEAEKKVTSKLTDLDLTKKFHAIPQDKIIGGHSDGIALAVKSYLSSKYDFALDEKGESTIALEKGTAKRVTLKDAGGKEYFAPVDELIVSSLKELKLTKESNGGEGSGNSGKGGSSNGQQPQKSQKMLELEAKANKAAA